MIKILGALLPCVFLGACAASNTIRTSADTAIVQTSAAPVCGGIGAAKVAQKQAAIETLKAGYDRYMIAGASAANNVHVSQMPGYYQTYGTATAYGNMATYQGTTSYVPGATIVSGTHDQGFAIKMLKNTDPGASQAISARETLGPKWPELVKAGAVHTCA
ncbi:hypothetical protein [Phyllobacterium zundukense]|uniref:Uncharacterized protein n=1 Tax=Phyllobacterium zundukense TaxID=1867719 RepID=A0A2N9W066_9HYPH|nr:hypothetical protein [Phyllobacterium zundukense]ATU90627.1 hypothetical protein BLM14_02355 [Phyllobacterium zundukense]PIO45134.1 hypothetical protein B5P45_08805 [Phyllobacterium zundukense]